MATILQFRPALERTSSRTRPEHRRGQADIVLFPGVRYEHSAAVPSPRKGLRNRDTLELLE